MGINSGSRPCLIAEGFVSHGNAPGVEQLFGQFPIGGKMEISEDDLPAAQQWQFAGLRLFHLDDHFRAAVNFLGAGNHFGAVAEIIVVGQAGAQTGAGFDQHFVSAAGQFINPDGQHAHPIFILLNFLWYADDHE